MKRTLLAILILAAGFAGLQAQGTTLSLQNQENAWFYFLIDPAEIRGLTPSSPSLPGKVAQFFGKESEEFPFTALQPLAGIKVEGLSQGTHLLVGFFAFEDRDEFPVRVVSLQVDGRMGERFYPIYSDPVLLSVSREKGRLIRFARKDTTKPAAQSVVKEETPAVKEEPAAVKPAASPTVAMTAGTETAAAKPTTAEKTVEPASTKPEPATELPAAAKPAAVAAEGKADAFPPIASFTKAYQPEFFTREDGDGLHVLDIAESQCWGKPGTGLQEVRVTLKDGILRLTVLSQAPFAQNVSYFLYAFSDRKPGSVCPFTVEVKPVGKTGPGVAVLWEKDAKEPLLYGETAAEGNTITVLLDVSALPDRFWQKAGQEPSFDLTSCWFDSDAKTYEEFYLTSFSVSDIPEL